MFYLDKTYWNKNVDRYDTYKRYFDELVPSRGAADTLEGTLLRAMSNLTYDHYNNGSCNARIDMSNKLVAHSDLFDDDVRDSIELIDDVLTQLDREDAFYLDDVFGPDKIERFEIALRNVTDAIVDYVEDSPAVEA